ncbi:MAG: hypothetical protein CMH60_07560 [Myxococcales bacterium]|nr:hypothetical protein [Myxococcales bacterium]|tara:strand:- start:1079 stop:2047 length:969 start_codon:yes stop_codon:yes gene_type:complete
MVRNVFLFASFAFFLSCNAKNDDDIVPLEPPPEGEGFQLVIEGEAPPYSEVWLCSVYPIPIEELSPVNRVEYQQNDGMHHMTLSTTGIGVEKTIADGIYDCAELYGDSSIMNDQLMFFGAQGTAEETLMLPKGVVANLIPGLDILHEIHYVNPTDKTVKLYSRVNAWTIPLNEVEEAIWGGQVRDEQIEIPPNSEHTEWTRCVMNEDVEVLFLASHSHALGKSFKVGIFDGVLEQEYPSSEVFYENTDWHTPLITQYDPPLIVPAGTGFEYSCTWKNNSDKTIPYGLDASDEMCNLAIVHTPYSTSALCEVVETSDGVLYKP